MRGRFPGELPDHLSMMELANRWGTSVATLHKGRKHGEFATIYRRGAYYVPIEEVEILEQNKDFAVRIHRRVDPLEVNAFNMFALGRNRSEVVLALRVTPKVVDRLYEDYVNSDLEARRLTQLYDEKPPVTVPQRFRRAHNKSKITKSSAP